MVSNIFGIVTPKIGEDFQFDEHIFQMGWFNHRLVAGMFNNMKSSPLKMGRAPKGNVHLRTSNHQFSEGYAIPNIQCVVFLPIFIDILN